MLKQNEIAKAAEAASFREYGKSVLNMNPHSPEYKSASGFVIGFSEGANWVQTPVSSLKEKVAKLLNWLLYIISWLGTVALWFLVAALFLMFLTKGSMTITLGYGK